MKSFLNNLAALFSKVDFKRPTSISDSKQYSGYLASVKKAVSNKETFLKFRSDPNYVAVLEHVTQNEGQEYLRIAKEEHGFSPNKLSLLQDLSSVGQPATYRYLDEWDVSPTVLRYVKVACEISDLFGDLKQKRIGEIGGGWRPSGGAREAFFDNGTCFL